RTFTLQYSSVFDSLCVGNRAVCSGVDLHGSVAGSNGGADLAGGGLQRRGGSGDLNGGTSRKKSRTPHPESYQADPALLHSRGFDGKFVVSCTGMCSAKLHELLCRELDAKE